jgi:hypothetical protein
MVKRYPSPVGGKKCPRKMEKKKKCEKGDIFFFFDHDINLKLV